MNPTTQTAFRAIIMGLELAGVVNDDAVASVIQQLRIAADAEADAERQDEADELRCLADDLEADARLDMPLG